jgi:hypothetical protein
MKAIRIIIAFPGDVSVERCNARKVLGGLQKRYADRTDGGSGVSAQEDSRRGAEAQRGERFGEWGMPKRWSWFCNCLCQWKMDRPRFSK